MFSRDEARNRRTHVELAFSDDTLLSNIIQNHSKLDITLQCPKDIEMSQVFYVDMVDKTVGDVMRDGACSWRNGGTFSWEYQMRKDGVGFICRSGKTRKSEQRPRQTLKADMVRLVKTYFSNDIYKVKRWIAYVETPRQPICNNIVVVGYAFEDQEKKLYPPVHGNSQSNKSSTRVKPSIMNKVASMTQIMPVTRAIEQHIASEGGRDMIRPECRPTADQLYKLRNKARSSGIETDSFQAMMEFAKDNPTIVREVKAHPEPYVIMATDQQLRDLDRFCKGKHNNPS